MAGKKISREIQASESPAEALGKKAYEKELKRLHVELVKLQQWVVAKGLKVCIVFEGRDGAGKGGTIKAITERVSPRIFRVVAAGADRAREKPDVRCSATSATFRRQARSSSSIAAGTTAPGSNG
jgi:polyphosphate kinase 2 (PPK2 family)